MNEIILKMALSMMPLKRETQRYIIENVENVFLLHEYRNDIGALLSDANDNAKAMFSNFDKYIDCAKREYERTSELGIQIIAIDDKEYPERMRRESDMPIVIYKTGHTDLNRSYAVSIVGTRKCTPYGRDVCNQFVDELQQLVPDLVVFSGLAYGIDITAHRRCIKNGIPTVGVMAHGLDIVYPSAHRTDANTMCKGDGALISEYTTGTDINRYNFISRNRIIAACSDATIVVESSEKGGSLHTAEMAQDYNRNVYAFPGRVTDTQSYGCLDLVSNNTAALIRSAEQFVKMQGWENIKSNSDAVQTELFTDLDDTAKSIVSVLRSQEQLTFDKLASATGINPMQLHSSILQLEIEGIIEMCAGSVYRLCNRYKN